MEDGWLEYRSSHTVVHTIIGYTTSAYRSSHTVVHTIIGYTTGAYRSFHTVVHTIIGYFTSAYCAVVHATYNRQYYRLNLIVTNSLDHVPKPLPRRSSSHTLIATVTPLIATVTYSACMPRTMY